MGTILIIGDSFAELKAPGVTFHSVGALSATDSLFARLIKAHAPTNQPFFLSPGIEFHGVRKAKEIIEKMTLPCDQRLIDHEGMETRTCRAFLKFADEPTREKLLANYLEMIDYWMVNYPKAILAPLASYRYTNFLKIGLVKSYHHLHGKYKNRMVNLSKLPIDNSSLWSQDTIHLSKTGRDILLEEMQRCFRETSTATC